MKGSGGTGGTGANNDDLSVIDQFMDEDDYKALIG